MILRASCFLVVIREQSLSNVRYGVGIILKELVPDVVGTPRGEVSRMEKEGLGVVKDATYVSEECWYVKKLVTSVLEIRIGEITGVSWGVGSKVSFRMGVSKSVTWGVGFLV